MTLRFLHEHLLQVTGHITPEEAPASSMQELLTLQEAAIAAFVWNLVSALGQLMEMSLIIFAACVSVTVVAQQKAERNPNLPRQQLFLIGGLFGALFALFSGWNWGALPVFGFLAGVANMYFPYRFYMTEIQKDPAIVAADTTGAEPYMLSPKMLKHVLIGLAVGAGLLACNIFAAYCQEDRISELVTNAFGSEPWLAALTEQTAHPQQDDISAQVCWPWASCEGHCTYTESCSSTGMFAVGMRHNLMHTLLDPSTSPPVCFVHVMHSYPHALRASVNIHPTYFIQVARRRNLDWRSTT